MTSDSLPSAANGGPAVPQDGVDWRRLVRALMRYKWTVLLVTTVGMAGGVWATRFVHPQYLVQGTVWIDQPSPRQAGGDHGPIRSGQLFEPEAWIDLLKSYVVLDHVVRDIHLYLRIVNPLDTAAMRSFGVKDGFRPGDYHFTTLTDGSYQLSTDDGIELDTGTLGDSVGVRLGFRWAPGRGDVAPGRTVQFTLLPPRDAARDLAERLTVKMDPEGTFLKVELTGTHPRQITAIVNAVVERYVNVAADLKKGKLTEVTRILDDQLEFARRKLDSAEIALERFRVVNITQPGDRVSGGGGQGGNGTAGTVGGGEARDPAFASFFELQMERDGIRRDRETLERWLSASSGARAVGPIEALASVQASADLSAALKELAAKQADLRALRLKYTNEYLAVQRAQSDVAAIQDSVVPGLVQSLVGDLRTREADLDPRLAGTGGRLRQIPARGLEEARLRRTVTLAENLYTTLQQRFEANKIEEASTIPDVRVLDAAVTPMQPFKNTARRIILLAFLASFGLAAGGVVLLDKFDPRVRYPEHVSHDLGLPILGVVPQVKARGTGYQLSREEAGEVVESLRGVCLNLLYSAGSNSPLVVTITSPGPGDGKSFLSANLALTFSDGGHRTLLIDADIRRGALHRRFQVPRRPGLTEYLRGEASSEAVIVATPYSSLSILPCGSRTQGAPELLGSLAMNALLNRLRGSYDVIIVDSPPLTGGVDPFILGPLTGNMILVLRTGFSHRDIAAAKLETVARLPVRLLGAVLNAVPPGGAYRYYSYYLPGYEGVEEDGAARRPAIV